MPWPFTPPIRISCLRIRAPLQVSVSECPSLAPFLACLLCPPPHGPGCTPFFASLSFTARSGGAKGMALWRCPALMPDPRAAAGDGPSTSGAAQPTASRLIMKQRASAMTAHSRKSAPLEKPVCPVACCFPCASALQR